MNFPPKNINANVAIMLIIGEVPTGNQGGRGLTSFVGIMNFPLFKILFDFILFDILFVNRL